MNEHKVPIGVAQSIIIKFSTKENVKPTKIWKRLNVKFGNATLST